MVMPASVALACALALAAPGGVAAAPRAAAPADADVVRGRVLVKLAPGASIALGADGTPSARRADGRADLVVARALARAGVRATGAALAVAPRDQALSLIHI